MGQPLLIEAGQYRLLLVKSPHGATRLYCWKIGSVVIERDIATHCDVGIGLTHGIEQRGGKLGMKDVVAVHHDDQFALHRVEGGVARGRMAAVGLVNDADARVSVGPTVAQLSRAIGAAIVHHEDFEMRIALGDNALDALVQKSLRVISGHDDRYQRLRNHSDIS